MRCERTGDPRQFQCLDRLFPSRKIGADRWAGRTAKQQPILIGDIILTEVLQGFTRDSDFNKSSRMLGALELIEIGGREVGIQAAHNDRLLRARGVTVRKTIDTLIATRCIEDGIPLLFSDRDYQTFVDHLGLVAATSPVPVRTWPAISDARTLDH